MLACHAKICFEFFFRHCKILVFVITSLMSNWPNCDFSMSFLADVTPYSIVPSIDLKAYWEKTRKLENLNPNDFQISTYTDEPSTPPPNAVPWSSAGNQPLQSQPSQSQATEEVAAYTPPQGSSTLTSRFAQSSQGRTGLQSSVWRTMNKGIASDSEPPGSLSWDWLQEADDLARPELNQPSRLGNMQGFPEMVGRLGMQSVFINAEDEANMERKDGDFQTQPMNDPMLNSDND
jgi:hypothetical protein